MALKLEDFISEGYCVRCNSHGHTERKQLGDSNSMVWCNVCWDWAQPLPKQLRDAIQAVLRS